MKRYVSAACLLHLSATISALLALLTVELERAPVFAAEPPASAETIALSVEVGRNLGEVVNLMDAGKFAEASAAMQTLLPLLQLGERLHIGKETVMGLGRYRLSA